MRLRHRKSTEKEKILVIKLFLLLRFLLLPGLGPHRLPPHKVAADGEEDGIDRHPGEQDAEIEPDPRMQIEEGRARCFDDCGR